MLKTATFAQCNFIQLERKIKLSEKEKKLESIGLNKVAQTQKGKYWIFSFICRVYLIIFIACAHVCAHMCYKSGKEIIEREKSVKGRLGEKKAEANKDNICDVKTKGSLMEGRGQQEVE